MDKRVVFVTGSSRGIGSSIVLEFAKNGYDVVIHGYKNTDKAFELARFIENTYDVKTLVVTGDISKLEDVEKMFLDISTKFGKIDVLVNNAAICNDSLVCDKTKDSFTRILEVNLTGSFLITKHAKELLSNESNIIFISSTNGIDTYYPYSMDYDASKAGVISLMHNYAVEYAPIRVNAIAPGWVDTDMNKNLDIEFRKKEEQKILQKRFANKDEIAKVVYFLASDNASYINNTVIRVDGGYYGY